MLSSMLPVVATATTVSALLFSTSSSSSNFHQSSSLPLSSSSAFHIMAATSTESSASITALRASRQDGDHSNNNDNAQTGYYNNGNFDETNVIHPDPSDLSAPTLRLRGGGGEIDGDDDETEAPSAREEANEVEGITTRGNGFWKKRILTPRVKSCTYMALAMSFHFGGYEFARSGALALFTSNQIGFTHPAAYPFAIGLITPTSLILLYWYGLLLKSQGPRLALRITKTFSMLTLSCSSILLAIVFQSLKVLSSTPNSYSTHLLTMFQRLLVAIIFVFQNSYAHLLYTQQWSFLGSIMTPSEGQQYFAAIAGLCSLTCTITASIVKVYSSQIGLIGLILGTCGTLVLSLLCADRAYLLSEMHGFDPAETMLRKQKEKNEPKSQPQPSNDNDKPVTSSSSSSSSSSSLLSKTSDLFRRVPTLAALFGEVICFQSLSTILNVCFVRQLKESVPLDTDRASYSGQFYSYVNGVAGILQFFVLPFLKGYLEPKWAYKIMPMFLLPILGYLNWTILTKQATTSLLWLTAAAFFCLKTLDYSIKGVVNEMVYQPLDFDSRYLGKEVIGVFANRFGKSGMSLLLSLATATFGASTIGVPQLSQFSLVVGGIWTSCSWWLSRFLLTNKEAEQQVQNRNNKKAR